MLTEKSVKQMSRLELERKGYSSLGLAFVCIFFVSGLYLLFRRITNPSYQVIIVTFMVGFVILQFFLLTYPLLLLWLRFKKRKKHIKEKRMFKDYFNFILWLILVSSFSYTISGIESNASKALLTSLLVVSTVSAMFAFINIIKFFTKEKEKNMSENFDKYEAHFLAEGRKKEYEFKISSLKFWKRYRVSRLNNQTYRIRQEQEQLEVAEKTLGKTSEKITKVIKTIEAQDVSLFKNKIKNLELDDKYKEEISYEVEDCNVRGLFEAKQLKTNVEKLRANMIAGIQKAGLYMKVIECQVATLKIGQLNLSVIKGLHKEGTMLNKKIQDLLKECEKINNLTRIAVAEKKTLASANKPKPKSESKETYAVRSPTE